MESCSVNVFNLQKGSELRPRAEVNCAPLSEVIVCGTPNLVIQDEQKTSAQAEAVVEDRGTASAHRVVRSTMVKMCVKPCEGGSGPTISTCT